jgi:hypothetical protein
LKSTSVLYPRLLALRQVKYLLLKTTNGSKVQKLPPAGRSEMTAEVKELPFAY